MNLVTKEITLTNEQINQIPDYVWNRLKIFRIIDVHSWRFDIYANTILSDIENIYKFEKYPHYKLLEMVYGQILIEKKLIDLKSDNVLTTSKHVFFEKIHVFTVESLQTFLDCELTESLYHYFENHKHWRFEVYAQKLRDSIMCVKNNRYENSFAYTRFLELCYSEILLNSEIIDLKSDNVLTTSKSQYLDFVKQLQYILEYSI